MAQAANIVVNDRATTPVAHTFVPRGGPDGTYSFTETGDILMGEKKLTLRWRKSASRYYQRVTLSVPALVTETINGVSVPSVPRVALIDATFRFDESSTLQERKDAVGMFANALAASQTLVSSVVVNCEGVF